jgi:hypothetical protein
MRTEEIETKIATSENSFWTAFFNTELCGLVVQSMKYTYSGSFIIKLRDESRNDDLDYHYEIHEFHYVWRFETADGIKIRGHDEDYDREKYIKITDRIIGTSIEECHFDKKGQCMFQFSDKSRFVLTPDYGDEPIDAMEGWMIFKEDKWAFSCYSQDQWVFAVLAEESPQKKAAWAARIKALDDKSVASKKPDV